MKKLINAVFTFALSVAAFGVVGFCLASAVLTEAECAAVVAAVKGLFG